MPLEVVTLSDTEDLEHANEYEYTSDDTDIVVLAVSSPAPEPPSSSQPRSVDVSSTWDRSEAEDQDDSEPELLDPVAVVSASQSRGAAGRNSGISSVSHSQTRSNSSITPGGDTRKSSALDSSDSDSLAVAAAPRKPVKRRKKKTEEEKVYERAEKEAKKLAKQEETRRKNVAAVEKKEAAAAAKAAEKLSKKASKSANKLVTDKKATLKDMTIELSGSLLSSPLHAPLLEKMEEYECVIAPIAGRDAIVENTLTKETTDLDDLGIKLIRWKRRVSAKYDENLRQWIPLGEGERHTRTEGTYLIFVAGRTDMRDPSITEKVRGLRTALGPKHHIHVMLCGWKPSRKEEREIVEQELVRLQVRESIFVEQVPNIEEAVNWIYNMTADLGIKPHKLIERSHLPFCAVGSSAMKVGKSDGETMVRMLTQLPRLTEPSAQAIVREYKTLNRVMEAYQMLEAESPRAGVMMLADVEVDRTKKGKGKSQVLNKALSERLYSLLWGDDPKALVN